jgi:RNA polymerase sigma-70 factor (ECF subfamily)
VQDKGKEIGEMIQLARRGDRDALGRLLEGYRPWLHILAQRQIGGPLARRVDASDVVQDTFLEAHRDFGRFAGATGPEVMAWLSRVLDNNVAETIRNQAMTAKRAVGREQELGASTAVLREPTSGRTSPSQRAMRSEEAALLARAIAGLPADQAEAVRLRHLEGWSLAQIAEHMDRSPVAAAGLIKRALQNLRQTLGPRG